MMKRYPQTKLLVGLLVLCLLGCYKDKGNYAYVALPDLSIDTSDIQDQFIISQYDTLRLSPNLHYAGDRANLTFAWSVYLYQTPFNGNPADTLSTQASLVAPITLFPEKYYLEFSAQEKDTGRKTTYRYVMQVEGIGSGMMVLYERGDQVDIDLIKTKLLEGLLPEDVLVRNLYSLANPGRPLHSPAVGMGMYKGFNEQFVHVFSGNDGVSLSPADMTVDKEFSRLFSLAPSVAKPEAYFVPSGVTQTDLEMSDGMEFLVNDGQAYANIIVFAFGQESAFSLLLTSGDDYQAAPFMCYGSARIVVYDQLKGRFLGAGALSTSLDPILSSGAAFDFKAIGKEMLFMGAAYGGQYVNYGIFKNKADDGKRYLYIMDFDSSAALAAWDISGYPQIADATSFAFATRSPLVYYAAHNKVYQVKYNWNSQTEQGAVEAWGGIPADEEITMIKLCPHPGRNVPENAKDKYLFIATYNQATGEGKIYVLENNVTSGVFKSQPAAVYGAFGKVKDLAFKY